MSVNRASEDGWLRIGRLCSAGRRSIWVRENRSEIDGRYPITSYELCGGREGDDGYLLITADQPGFAIIDEWLGTAIFYAEETE